MSKKFKEAPDLPTESLQNAFDQVTTPGSGNPEAFDNVQKPKHYNVHPSKVECIQITEHMNFCLGNAMKYIWRADLKNGVEDLKKAVWYIQREIQRRENV